ncbi:hypothetical protein K7X08_030887 [Anisodus acutangulus]|uniref:Uncharacterized protein n=1 Tax=Anisodus acutangulus TaxID=402998 RepID=A0A9Q1M440_9SOLA|nr:hypothetical protein K7X08_030887 [Anisodus acutangulus]
MNDDLLLSKKGGEKESTSLVDADSGRSAEGVEDKTIDEESVNSLDDHPSDILQEAVKVAKDKETCIEEQSKQDIKKTNVEEIPTTAIVTDEMTDGLAYTEFTEIHCIDQESMQEEGSSLNMEVV